MGWLSRRRDSRTPASDAAYRVARERVEELEHRAERVVPKLNERRNRNHWGEAIAAIARKGHA